MITKEQADAILIPLGFTVYCYDGNHNPTYMNMRGINIFINLQENSFRIRCYVDQIFILDSLSASPFISTEYNQFDRFYQRFINIMDKLNL